MKLGKCYRCVRNKNGYCPRKNTQVKLIKIGCGEYWKW